MTDLILRALDATARPVRPEFRQELLNSLIEKSADPVIAEVSIAQMPEHRGKPRGLRIATMAAVAAGLFAIGVAVTRRPPDMSSAP